MAGWRSELAGWRSTLSMLKIKVKILQDLDWTIDSGSQPKIRFRALDINLRRIFVATLHRSNLIKLFNLPDRSPFHPPLSPHTWICQELPKKLRKCFKLFYSKLPCTFYLVSSGSKKHIFAFFIWHNWNTHLKNSY